MRQPSASGASANRFSAILLAIYILVLCWILLLKLGVQFSYMENRSVNLIPFNEPDMLTSENILNVLVFVPLGIYTGALFKQWTFGKQLIIFLLCSVVVEVIQYVFRLGAFDATDIITNTTGGIIGFAIFVVLEKMLNSQAKAQRLINIFAAAGTALIVTLLVLLKMNMLPIRYQ